MEGEEEIIDEQSGGMYFIVETNLLLTYKSKKNAKIRNRSN